MKRKAIPHLFEFPNSHSLNNREKLLNELNAYLRQCDPRLHAAFGSIRVNLYYGPFHILRFVEWNGTKQFETVDAFETTLAYLKKEFRLAAQDLEMARQFLANDDLTAEQLILAQSFTQMREKDVASLKQQLEQAEVLLPKARQAQVEWLMRLMAKLGYVRGQIGDD